MLRLSELLTALSESQVMAMPADPVVRGVTYDSRAVEPGFIFVAIPGALTDGHLYIADAIIKGAVAIVCERPQMPEGVAEIRVPLARRALAELSRAFFHYPDRHLFMLGVTATNGKTTTTSMVQHILTGQGVMTALIGSVAYSFGEVKAQSSLTTPESSDLHAMLAKQRQAGVQVVAMEVSSIAEAQYRVHGIDYDAVAYLNITPDHMPDHGSFEAYYEAKAKLVRQVAPGVPVILNRDEPTIFKLAEETRGQVISMGIDHPQADVTAVHLKMPGGIPQFELRIRRRLKTRRGIIEPGSWQVNLAVPGRHTVYNAMAAILLAACWGLPVQEAVSALADFPGVERRLQIIYRGDFTIIDDHISDEDNTRKMLEALTVMAEGKPVRILYAIRGSRGVQVNREVIGQFKEYKDKINWQTFMVTSSRDLARARDLVLPEELDAVLADLEEAGYRIDEVDDLRQAIKKILPLVEPGDFLVLAGSHNMDKGARIALNLLADQKPGEEREAILKPLE